MIAEITFLFLIGIIFFETLLVGYLNWKWGKIKSECKNEDWVSGKDRLPDNARTVIIFVLNKNEKLIVTNMEFGYFDHLNLNT